MQDATVKTDITEPGGKYCSPKGMKEKIVSGLHRRGFARASFLFQWLAVLWQAAIQ